jgi:ABC-type uncharacterized transport system ATPase subunit
MTQSDASTEATQPGTAARPGAPTAVVELSGIRKTFPGVVANDNVDLTIRAGEVHCLLGENGAGKSTLMNILAGMYRPDAGRIVIDGTDVELDSPKRSLALGIGMVYQHSTLIPTLTVLENLMLGSSDLLLDAKGSRARLAELAEMLGVEVDPDAQAGSLALGRQQQVEIMKALWRGSRVLILDEPTSMLTPQGVAELGRVLGRLTGEGLAVVFITHKLHEAIELGDCVSVLKQGRLVGAVDPETLGSRDSGELQSMIVALMFGEESKAVADVAELQDDVEGRRPRRELASEYVLELVHVTTEPKRDEIGVHDISLGVRGGEIMGIAGVDGNGQRELAEAIAGQRRVVAGDVRLESRSIATLSVARRQRLGLRYVTDDRLGEGTVSAFTVALNLVLKRIGQFPFWRRGVVRRRAIDETARDLVQRFDIRTPGVGTRVGTLSGGNIQKLLLAREVSFEPKLVVYNKPTHGLDVRTMQAVRERIHAQADDGVAALVISTDLDELLQLCDRIAVLFRGRVSGVVDNGRGADERIGELMVGGKAA